MIQTCKQLYYVLSTCNVSMLTRITSLTDNLVEVENLATFPADMLAVTGSRRLVSVVSV